MATLPRQIQAQLDAAAALTAPPAPATTEAPAAEVQPPAPANPEPAALPPPPAPAPVVLPQPTQEDLEQKYRSLQGIHRHLTQENDVLKQRLAEIEARLTAPPAPAPAAQPAPQPVVDPKDVDAYGADMIAMVQRVAEQYMATARQAVEGHLATLVQRVGALEQQLRGTAQAVTRTTEEMFFDRLTELVPQWEQINAHDAFQAYLAEKDPVYGLPRDAALKDARTKGDAPRAANVFTAFLATLPKPPAAPPAESPSPRGAGSAPPAGQPQAVIVPQSEVVAFYNDVRRGVYRNNPQEHQRLQAYYNVALAEGRIR